MRDAFLHHVKKQFAQMSCHVLHGYDLISKEKITKQKKKFISILYLLLQPIKYSIWDPNWFHVELDELFREAEN